MLVESVSPHPLAEEAQACGRLTQVDAPEGPIALLKKKLDYISRLMPIILAPIILVKNPRIVFVILAQGPC